MNKLLVAVGLCFVVPMCSMDSSLVKKEASEKKFQLCVEYFKLPYTTPKESEDFSSHLNRAVGFNIKMVQEKKVPENNPVHVILRELNSALAINHNNDIRLMIASDKDLERNIKMYLDIENNDLVKFGLQQVRLNVGNVEEAKKFTIRLRSLTAGLSLTKKYSEYSNGYMGEVQTEDRINYMFRNANYPLTDIAKKDFIALFIYQLLFATKID